VNGYVFLIDLAVDAQRCLRSGLQAGKSYWLRTPIREAATAAFRATGIAIPPTMREK